MLARFPLLSALSCALAGAPVARAQAAANSFLDDTHIQQVALTVTAPDWNSFLQNYESDTYYPATFTWNGIVEEIGIRQHGNVTRSPIKPSIDLNFAYYSKKQTFLGLDFALLKANNDDASNLHDWISMKLFRSMGFPAPRTAPAQLYVNGQYFGFYFVVEHEDSSFLQRNFGESGGYLYEWQFQTGYNFQNLGTDPSAYAPLLKLKSNQSAPDLQTFCDLVQVVNKPSDSSFSDADFIVQLSRYIDPKSFLTYAATEGVLAEFDAMVGGVVGMNNFYLYQFKGTTFFQLIPWDKGMTFSDPNRDLMTGFTLPPNINVLAQRLIAIPPYRSFYLGQAAKAAALLGDINGWAARQLEFEYNLIDAAASNDPNKQCDIGGQLYSCGTADFQSAVQSIFTFLQQRSAFVLQEVSDYGYVSAPNDPQIQSALMTTPPGFGGATAAVTPPFFAAPGAFVTITGANFGSAASATGAPFTRSLGSVYVSVEGIRAPIVSVSDTQIEFQAPNDLAAGRAEVVVSVEGETSNTFDLQVQQAVPGILALTHQTDGSAINVSNPARAAEIVVVYASGLGTINGTFGFGLAAPQMPLISTVLTPSVSLSGAPLKVISSTLAAGYAGVYAVSILMPDNLPASGSANLTLSAGPPSLAATTSIALASQ